MVVGVVVVVGGGVSWLDVASVVRISRKSGSSRRRERVFCVRRVGGERRGRERERV